MTPTHKTVRASHPYKAKNEIRRANLRQLSKIQGEQKDLAAALGWSESRLSQLIGQNPSRNVTEKVALHVEFKLGLAAGWMSEDHSPAGVE